MEISTGPWKDEEINRLLDALSMFGASDFSRISNYVKTKSSTQCKKWVMEWQRQQAHQQNQQVQAPSVPQNHQQTQQWSITDDSSLLEWIFSKAFENCLLSPPSITYLKGKQKETVAQRIQAIKTICENALFRRNNGMVYTNSQASGSQIQSNCFTPPQKYESNMYHQNYLQQAETRSFSDYSSDVQIVKEKEVRKPPSESRRRRKEKDKERSLREESLFSSSYTAQEFIKKCQKISLKGAWSMSEMRILTDERLDGNFSDWIYNVKSKTNKSESGIKRQLEGIIQLLVLEVKCALTYPPSVINETKPLPSKWILNFIGNLKDRERKNLESTLVNKPIDLLIIFKAILISFNSNPKDDKQEPTDKPEAPGKKESIDTKDPIVQAPERPKTPTSKEDQPNPSTPEPHAPKPQNPDAQVLALRGLLKTTYPQIGNTTEMPPNKLQEKIDLTSHPASEEIALIISPPPLSRSEVTKPLHISSSLPTTPTATSTAAAVQKEKVFIVQKDTRLRKNEEEVEGQEEEGIPKEGRSGLLRELEGMDEDKSG